MIEPIVKRMQGSRMREVEGMATTQALNWRSTYDDISIPIVADWPLAGLPLGDIARLRAGDILKLPANVGEKTRLRVANTTQFIGRAGRENGRVAVQVNTRVGGTL
jgi:flagellar motor switch protein FliM